MEREEGLLPNQESDDLVGVFRIVEMLLDDLILMIAIAARSSEHRKWQVRYRQGEN